MRKRLSVTTTSSLLCALVLAGCAPAPDAAEPPELATVYQSGQCGDHMPGLHLLEDQAALDDIAAASGIVRADGQRRTGPQVNFGVFHVLLITEGPRNTGGYSIRLNDDSVRLEQDTVILPVDFIHPEEGGLVSLALTSPCLVVTLGRSAYSEIQAGAYTLTLD